MEICRVLGVFSLLMIFLNVIRDFVDEDGYYFLRDFLVVRGSFIIFFIYRYSEYFNSV